MAAFHTGITQKIREAQSTPFLNPEDTSSLKSFKHNKDKPFFSATQLFTEDIKSEPENLQKRIQFNAGCSSSSSDINNLMQFYNDSSDPLVVAQWIKIYEEQRAANQQKKSVPLTTKHLNDLCSSDVNVSSCKFNDSELCLSEEVLNSDSTGYYNNHFANLSKNSGIWQINENMTDSCEDNSDGSTDALNDNRRHSVGIALNRSMDDCRINTLKSCIKNNNALGTHMGKVLSNQMRPYFILLFLVAELCWSAKILITVPQFGGSQIHLLGNVADLLVTAGHDVTVLIFPIDPYVRHMNGTKLAKIIKTPVNQQIADTFDGGMDDFITNMWTQSLGNPISLYFTFSFFRTTFCSNCADLIANKELASQIKEQKFDLMVAEVFDSCSFGLVSKWDIPTTIAIGTNFLNSPIYEILGIRYPVENVPEMFAGYGDTGMNFWERVQNIYFNYALDFFIGGIMRDQQKLFDTTYGYGVANIKEAIANCAYFVTNRQVQENQILILNSFSDILLDFPHPTTSKILEVGGLSIPEAKPLTGFWDEILGRRKFNVLISFGSNAHASRMPQNYKETFLKVFKTFKDVTFILKYELTDDGIADKVENLVISKWIPQNDLLSDSRLSGFVTHGGYNSIIEAAYAGIPVISVGLFGDQERNSIVVQKIKFGRAYSKFDLSDYEALNNAIKEVFFGIEYKQNALRLQQMLLQKPYSAKEVFLRHVEYAAKFGAQENLNMIGRDHNIIERNNLDIMFVVLLITMILLAGMKVCFVKIKSNLFPSRHLNIKKTN
uniref:Glucuronosyltransferase n=1 Tax=Rhabditophanes sp. KR3021 TaxID=114890 RepID=A0AC35TL31_9BILA